MGEIGEPFEDPEQLLVPGASPDLHIAGTALRAERPEPRQLVATLWGRQYGEATECAHQVERLALAGLTWILAEPDAVLVAILGGGIEQQHLDIAWVGPPAHHVQQPIAAALVAAEPDRLIQHQPGAASRTGWSDRFKSFVNSSIAKVLAHEDAVVAGLATASRLFITD